MNELQAINAVRKILEAQLKRAATRRCHIQINSEALETDPKTGYLCPKRIERVSKIVDALYDRETLAMQHLSDLNKAA